MADDRYKKYREDSDSGKNGIYEEPDYEKEEIKDSNSDKEYEQADLEQYEDDVEDIEIENEVKVIQ